MDLKEYTQAALKTESVPESINTNLHRLEAVLNIMINAGNMLDDLKKNIFYGKEIDSDKFFNQSEQIKESYLALPLFDIVNSKVINQNDVTDDAMTIDPRIAHGIIGIATESTELLEALSAYIKTGELDTVNVAEEVGDNNWYEAVLLDALGQDWETMLQTNIAKLEARYNGKFSSDKAINRDLDTERKILES